MRFPCDGPYLDEPGVWICRLDPEDVDYDCEDCHHRHDWELYCDRLMEMKRETEEEREREERGDTWG